jgi:GxxExxY protein
MIIGRQAINELSYKIISAAIEVHRELGPGLLESIYEQCLIQELQDRGLSVKSQVMVPVSYKGKVLAGQLRLDMMVEDTIIAEVKAIEQIHPAHRAQLLTYLRLTDRRLGLLMNFNEELMKHGIERVINGDLG